MTDIPGDLRYRATHEWLRLEGDIATVGISGFAMEQLGDIIDVEITREVGESVAAGDALAELESVKAASDIYAPIGGEVIEVHEGLVDDLEGMSAAPYDTGWMVKLKVSNVAEVEGLLSAEAYREQVASEA